MTTRYLSHIFTALFAGCFMACSFNSNKETPPTEIPLFGSDIQDSIQSPESIINDTLAQGPFDKEISFLRSDDNGGYEEYRLKMNLYKGDIPTTNGEFCFGILSLYIKTPENTEGIEVGRRIITHINAIDEETAQLTMSNNESTPYTFKATLTFNPEDYSYKLQMEADPAILDDLIANTITLF